MIYASTRLYWRFEDGPDHSDEVNDPDDVGSALILHEDGTEEAVNCGEWITRAEAEKLATKRGYRLQEDG